MAGLLAAEGHTLALHHFQHVPVADRRAEQPQAVLGAVFVQADVRHDRRHKAAAGKLPLLRQGVGADGHDLVAVDQPAVFIHGKAAVGVAVERETERIAALAHLFGQHLDMRRAAVVVDVDAVRRVVDVIHVQRKA